MDESHAKPRKPASATPRPGESATSGSGQNTPPSLPPCAWYGMTRTAHRRSGCGPWRSS